MRKELALIMIACTIGVSSAYGDSQINITQSPGQTVPPLTVTDSSSNVLFQVLSDGQAIVNQFIQFSGSGLTALRTYVFPDSDGTVVLEDTVQPLSQKIIDADTNTISNIDNNEIKSGAGIDVTKLSTGIVDDTEFDMLNNIGGNIQAQLNGKIDNGENVGTGTGQVFKDKSGINLRFKSIKAGNNISITNNADDITINATSTDGANVGTGTGLVFKDKSGANLRFKSIKAGNNISITNNANDITINSTSVGIPTLVKLGSDVSTSTNVCCTDATGLSFSVSSGKVYHFKFLVRYDTAIATNGIGLTLNGPAATFLTYDVIYPLTTQTGEIHGRNAYNSVNFAGRSPALTNNLGIIEGLIQPSANGVLIVRFISENVPAGSAITIKANSVGFLTVIP
jgi:ribosomal protein L24E